jgi:hypothetical protein
VIDDNDPTVGDILFDHVITTLDDAADVTSVLDLAYSTVKNVAHDLLSLIV